MTTNSNRQHSLFANQLLLMEQVPPKQFEETVQRADSPKWIRTIDGYLGRAILEQDQGLVDQAESLLCKDTKWDTAYKVGIRKAYLPAFRAQVDRRPLDYAEQQLCTKRAERLLASRVSPDGRLPTDKARRGMIGELLLLALIPGSVPALSHESNLSTRYNHDLYTIYPTLSGTRTKVPIEAKLTFCRKSKYEQDKNKVLIIAAMAAMDNAFTSRDKPGEADSDFARQFDAHIRDPRVNYFAQKKQKATTGLDFVISGILKHTRSEELNWWENECQTMLQWRFQESIDMFLLVNGLVPEADQEVLRARILPERLEFLTPHYNQAVAALR
jgi:hypothetical protein